MLILKSNKKCHWCNKIIYANTVMKNTTRKINSERKTLYGHIKCFNKVRIEELKKEIAKLEKEIAKI